MRSVTVFPASLMRLTMSEWDLLVMEQPFTARMRSPTFSFPQRSAGLPSMMRPILWGMATHALPAVVTIFMPSFFSFNVCGVHLKKGNLKGKGGNGKEQRRRKLGVNLPIANQAKALREQENWRVRCKCGRRGLI